MELHIYIYDTVEIETVNFYYINEQRPTPTCANYSKKFIDLVLLSQQMYLQKTMNKQSTCMDMTPDDTVY